jgi:hypothetical protein
MAVNPTAGQPSARSYIASSDIGIIIAITLLQYFWLVETIGLRIALVNFFPAVVLITVWTLFISHYYAGKPYLRILLLLPVLILCLRLPVTLSRDLQVVNWLMVGIMVGTVVRQIVMSFPAQAEKIYLILAFVILCANTFHHLGFDSPYTYTFRISNSVASAYVGVDNYDTYECAYFQTKFPVHCDAHHFSLSELIFTEPALDPSESVVLQRFLHGYLNSLAGLDGTRYWGNLMLNITFWFFACACIYRICRLLKLDRDIAGIAMLCCASAWGFVSMVAQPEPYMLAYAYALIVIWATLELIYNELDRRRTILFIILIASIVMIYDAYQMILISVFLLFFHKKRSAAISIFLLQFLFTAIWSIFSLKMVLGTQGDITSDSHSIANITLDITTWLNIVKTLDFSKAIHYSFTGMQAYLYGNLIIGAIAAWAYICGLSRPRSTTPEQKTLLLMLVILNVLVLASAIFIVPQMYHWSPESGMQPRIFFYSFPINMIALVLIASRWLKKYTWSIPVLLLIVANINLTGLASIDMLFDYGFFGIYWK